MTRRSNIERAVKGQPKERLTPRAVRAFDPHEENPPKGRRAPDPRHGQIKLLLENHWLQENPMIPSLPWGPQDAGALGLLLRANPNLRPEVVALCLANRLASEDHAPAERVYRWIGDVLRYSAGPLNRFKQLPRASEASAGANRPGKRYGAPDAPARPLREVMSGEWQDRAVRLSREARNELTDLEIQFLKEEGLYEP
jgi:hypothetical protein